jgi:hypothetical protein
VTDYGQAVWTLLIEDFLERVGQNRGDDGSHQYMIACASHRYVPGPCVEPPADRKRAKHMFVRTPRQGLRNMFGWSARVRRDTIRYRDVSFGRLHSEKGHACSVRLITAILEIQGSIHNVANAIACLRSVQTF